MISLSTGQWSCGAWKSIGTPSSGAKLTARFIWLISWKKKTTIKRCNRPVLPITLSLRYIKDLTITCEPSVWKIQINIG